MSDDSKNERDLSRRDALRLCLAPVGVAAASWLVGCAAEDKPAAGTDQDEDEDEHSDSASDETKKGTPDARVESKPANARDAGAQTSTNPSTDASASTNVDAKTPTSGDAGHDSASAAAADGGASSDAAVGDVPWASGGTKSMQGNYPDPFATGSTVAACALYPAATLGPCYSSGPAAREDISDGMTGLPLRLSFLVVRSDGCTPVPNAVVDIWHTGSNGVYSAFASGICNPDRLMVVNQRYCRGTQSTDASGRANFSTIFPGWYTGRAIHIHFTVRAGGRDFTSQLFFDDALSDDILAKADDYKARGKRDTTNKTDNVIKSVDVNQVLLSSTKRADGALHAWKVLSIRG